MNFFKSCVRILDIGIIFILITIMVGCSNNNDVIVYPNSEHENYEEEIFNLFESINFSSYEIKIVTKSISGNADWDFERTTFENIDQTFVDIIVGMSNDFKDYEYQVAQSGILTPDSRDFVAIYLENDNSNITISAQDFRSVVIFTYRDSNVEYDLLYDESPFYDEILKALDYIESE